MGLGFLQRSGRNRLSSAVCEYGSYARPYINSNITVNGQGLVMVTSNGTAGGGTGGFANSMRLLFEA